MERYESRAEKKNREEEVEEPAEEEIRSRRKRSRLAQEKRKRRRVEGMNGVASRNDQRAIVVRRRVAATIGKILLHQ